MDQTNNEALRRRIAELEAENARLANENGALREFNDLLQAQRKEHLDMILGPVDESKLPTEEEYIEMMKNHVPGSGLKFLAELGIYPTKPA